MKKILETKHIEKIYGKKGVTTEALKGITMDIEEGEFVGIMGASGSGKTTLLNCVSTIDTPTSGEIIVDGKTITNMTEKEVEKFRGEKLGFIFQDFNLLDTLTGFENIALSLSIKNTNPKEVKKRVKEIALLLDIKDVLNKFPYQMSGGQKQRVASARAIVTNPSLVLADEPTGALDSKSARQLLKYFELMNKARQTSILMVTHDAFTASYANRIIFINDGKIFTELNKENLTRKQFFDRIIEVISVLGGDLSDY